MEDIFNIPPQTRITDPVNFRVDKCYKQDKPTLHILINTEAPSYKRLREIANSNFTAQKTRNSFVKSYYLYCVLVYYAHLNDVLKTNEIVQILNTSHDNLKKINKLLQGEGCLVIDKTKYYDSLHNKLSASKYGEEYMLDSYSYTFHHIQGGYEIPKHSSCQKLSFILPQKIWNKLRDGGFTLNKNKTISEIIGNSSCKEDVKQQSYIVNNNSIYISPYHELTLSPDLLHMTVNEAYHFGDVMKLIQFMENKNRPAKFKSGRLYHPFHNLPHGFRNHLEYNGSRLVEAIDIHNAFFVFMAKLFLVSNSINKIPIPKDELLRFERIVVNGELYKDVMDYEGAFIRDQIKERLNAFKNDDASSMRFYPEYYYFKEKFPNILLALKCYPTYCDKNGNRVKYIQKDASYIETVLISSVCQELRRLNITPFSLHDAIYITMADKEKIQALNIDINQVFWDKYHSLSDEDVIRLISTCRSQDIAL